MQIAGGGTGMINITKERRKEKRKTKRRREKKSHKGVCKKK